MKTRKTLYITVGVVLVLLVVGVALMFSWPVEKALQRRRTANIRKKTADSFVVVHYHFKKSERPRPPDDDYDYNESEVLEKVLAKTSLDVVGVIISDEGEVLTAESHLWPDTIEKITVTGPDGAELGAAEGLILRGAPAQIVRISGDLPKSWKPLRFSAAPTALDMGTKLYCVSLMLGDYGEAQDDKEGRFNIMPAAPVRKRGNESNVPDYFGLGYASGVNVICGPDASVLGVSTYGRIETRSSAPAWRGADILADPGFMRQDGGEKIKQQFAEYLYQVKITFRPPPKEEDEYDMGMFGSFAARWRGQGEGKELFLYALAIAPDKLLLPRAMGREMVAGIDTLSVQVGDSYVPASFSGVLRQCEATVLTLNDAKLPKVASIDPQVGLPRTKPFWTVYARELAGEDLVVDYSRWIRKQRGYEGKLYRQAAAPIKTGCWLLDGQGRLAGLYTPSRRDYQRILPYLKGEGFDSYGPDFSLMRVSHRFATGWPYSPYGAYMNIFDNAALAGMLEDLPANYDPHIRHLTKEQQKKRVWLGVEFTGVSKEMAKQLNLRRHTQDGRIGLMINRVYPGSPAARMGLAEGDVLLKLSIPDAPWPIELEYGQGADYEGPDWGEVDVPEEFQRMGYRPPRKRPWPSRGNSFTRMLRIIGEGVKARLTYVHDGKQVTKEFAVEQSLPDSLSAEKYKDKKIGITVRDLTYEVRTALKLSEDDKAVVVSKVEPGTPTALARINAFELIRAVDGQAIGSVEEFASAIKKAKAEGKQSVRITVEWMGKTRLADLKFEAKGGGLRDMMRRFMPPRPSSSRPPTSSRRAPRPGRG